MTTRLRLICHAPTAATRAATFAADEPLEAKAQARLAALDWPLPPTDRAWSAPALRARQTAEALGLVATCDPALRDCDHGRWTGRSLEAVQAEEPEAVRAWLRDPDASPHGGEAISALIARVGAWMDHQGDTAGQVVAVTHASVIRAALVVALETGPQSFWRIDVAPLCAATLSGTRGRWMLAALGPLLGRGERARSGRTGARLREPEPLARRLLPGPGANDPVPAAAPADRRPARLSEPDDIIPFDRSMNARPDDLQTLSPLVRRLIANNGGPFTFTGTCSYIVGIGEVTVIDPGPADPQHLAALLQALDGETVAQILVTHTHRDHSPGAAALKAAIGAQIIGCAPYRPTARADGHPHPTDAAHDTAYTPDRILADGDRVSGPGYDLFAVATPGHAANHLAYALPQEGALFSGDHVMAWSTTVVAPPDGSMQAYMASLDRLRSRDDAVFWPGHGGPVRNPQRFVRALAQHRRHREHAIVQRLASGDALIETLVTRLYADLSPQLKGAAALSVLAHLQALMERGIVVASEAAAMQAHYTLA